MNINGKPMVVILLTAQARMISLGLYDSAKWGHKFLAEIPALSELWLEELRRITK